MSSRATGSTTRNWSSPPQHRHNSQSRPTTPRHEPSLSEMRALRRLGRRSDRPARNCATASFDQNMMAGSGYAHRSHPADAVRHMSVCRASGRRVARTGTDGVFASLPGLRIRPQLESRSCQLPTQRLDSPMVGRAGPPFRWPGVAPQHAQHRCYRFSLFEHPAAELSGDDSAGFRGHHREPDHVA